MRRPRMHQEARVLILAGVMLLSVVALAPPVGAAEIGDLPDAVRDALSGVKITPDETDEVPGLEAVDLKGLKPVGAATSELVTLDATGVGTSDSSVVFGDTLGTAKRSALVAMAASGKLSAEKWRQEIAQSKLTFADLCAVWSQFRRDHPRQGESPSHTRAIWHGARDALGLADADIKTLPTPELFVLAEMQLYPGEVDGAEECLQEILGRLEGGEPPGPRVTKGLIAYRIAQCYRRRGESGKAIEWFLKCGEWGAPTEGNPYDVRGEGLVEAARLLHQIGQQQKAEAAYWRALTTTTGYGHAVATSELFDGLIANGQFAAARSAMRELLTLQASGGEAVGAHAQIAYCHYLSGEDAAARQACKESIAAYEGLSGGEASGQCLDGVTRARTIVALLDQWEQSPLHASPKRVHVAQVARPRDCPQAVGAAGYAFSVRSRGTTHLRATSSLPFLRVSALDQTVEEYCARTPFRVDVSRDTRPGVFPGEIEITADAHPGQPLRVPVTVTVGGRLHVAPECAYFGFVTPDEEATTPVTLTGRERFRVTEVQSDEPGVVTVRVRRQSQTEWLVEATIQKGQKSGVLEGNITLLTDAPHHAVVTVPYYAHVTAVRARHQSEGGVM